jgi:hypothetical protein
MVEPKAKHKFGKLKVEIIQGNGQPAKLGKQKTPGSEFQFLAFSFSLSFC